MTAEDLLKAGESLTLKTNLDMWSQENEEVNSKVAANDEHFKNPQSKLETDNNQSKLSELNPTDKVSSSQRFYL